MGLVKCLFCVMAVALLVSAAKARMSWHNNHQRPVQGAQQPYPPPLLFDRLQQQSHQQQPQQQQSQQRQQQKTPVEEASFDKCQVDEEEEVLCGLRDITPEQCEAINCCFDGNKCYYGKAVTVQCTRDGQFVVVVARDATLPRLDVDSVSLVETNDASCNAAAVTSAFAIFQFPVTACGTTLMEESGSVVYENHMSSSYEVGVGPRGSITRDSQFELLFQCRYAGTSVEALVIQVMPVPPPIPVASLGPLRVEFRLGNGQCFSKGCDEGSAAYQSYYTEADYPVTKALREPLYAEVRILERTDPNIILNLDHCWATATPNPNSLPQWDLLVNGCPYGDDRYQTTLVPVTESSGLLYPSHYKRFIVKMFAFVNSETYAPQKDSVFIHCTAAVCHPSATDSCERSCQRLQRRAAPEERASPGRKALVSSGKVIMAVPQQSGYKTSKHKSK